MIQFSSTTVMMPGIPSTYYCSST